MTVDSERRTPGASAYQPHLPRAYHIEYIVEENETTRTYLLDGSMEAAPGQFVMAWLPGVDEKPFSLADANPIALTVARVGPFTTAMHGLNVGDHIWLRGPFGTGFSLEPGPALLVGGGYGSAPLSFLARSLRDAGQLVYAVLGARTSASLLLTHRFLNLGCIVYLATEDGSEGSQGLATDVAERLMNHIGFRTVYACGPNAMLDALTTILREHGLPGQLSYEAYMRCGIGVCGSCAHGDQLVCRDGPVFKFQSQNY
jgi:dihydroorotate dehydrogenase electron transfer subunit